MFWRGTLTWIFFSHPLLTHTVDLVCISLLSKALSFCPFQSENNAFIYLKIEASKLTPVAQLKSTGISIDIDILWRKQNKPRVFPTCC